MVAEYERTSFGDPQPDEELTQVTQDLGTVVKEEIRRKVPDAEYVLLVFPPGKHQTGIVSSSLTHVEAVGPLYGLLRILLRDIARSG